MRRARGRLVGAVAVVLSVVASVVTPVGPGVAPAAAAVGCPWGEWVEVGEFEGVAPGGQATTLGTHVRIPPGPHEIALSVAGEVVAPENGMILGGSIFVPGSSAPTTNIATGNLLGTTLYPRDNGTFIHNADINTGGVVTWTEQVHGPEAGWVAVWRTGGSSDPVEGPYVDLEARVWMRGQISTCAYGDLLGDPHTSGMAGDPVSAAIGNLMHPVGLLGVEGSGGALGLTYNSRDSSLLVTDPAFSPGWSSLLDAGVFPLGTGDPEAGLEEGAVVLRLPDGRELVFERDGARWVSSAAPFVDVDYDGSGGFEVTFPSGERWLVGASQRVDRREFPDGTWAEITRDESGFPSSMSTSAGASLTFKKSEFSHQRVVSGVVAGDGRRVDLGDEPFALNGSPSDVHRLASVSDPHLVTDVAWGVEEYTYTPTLGQLDQVVDTDNLDSFSRVVLDNDYGESPYSWNADSYTRVVRQTSESGDRTEFTYGDPSGSAGVAPSTEVKYLSAGAATQTVTYHHDADGLLTKVDKADGSCEWGWNADRQVESMWGFRGERGEVDYEEDVPTGLPENFELADPLVAGQTSGSVTLSWCEVDDPDPRPWVVQGPSGERTEFFYSDAGDPCPSGVVHPERVAVTTAPGEVSVWDYTWDAGLLVGVEDPDGVEFSQHWDPAKRRLLSRTVDGDRTYFGYDGAGRVNRVRSPEGNEVWSAFDAMGRVVSRVGPMPVSADRAGCDGSALVCPFAETSAPGGAPVSSTVFRTDGRVGSVTDNGHTTTWDYTWLGSPNGGRTVTQTRPVTPDVVAVGDRQTVWHYNAADQLTRVVVAGGAETLYSYDALGQLASVTDPEGVVTKYCYDASGQLTRTVAFDTGVNACTTLRSGQILWSTEYDLRVEWSVRSARAARWTRRGILRPLRWCMPMTGRIG